MTGYLRAMIAAMMLAALTVMIPVLPAAADDSWSGTWFTCEFARSQTPPDDQCAMFDDEGFRFSNGRFTYVRITESDETACRGEKVGQCFRRDRPAISISTSDRGKLDLGPEDQGEISVLHADLLFQGYRALPRNLARRGQMLLGAQATFLYRPL